MVGSAIALEAKAQGQEVVGKSSRDLDFTNRNEVIQDLISTKPNFLVIAAAKVGGIGANSTYPVEFLTLNLQLQTNLLDAAHEAKIRKVIFFDKVIMYLDESSLFLN